jgi:chitinase
MPLIGGWTLSDNFPGIAADPIFAQQCIELIIAYGFDGIDINWEYPGYVDHSGTPHDTVNFTLLLKAVRTKLDELGNANGKFYGLTAALPCGPDKIDKIQVNEIKSILTEFNLMSYDLHGAWDALITGINAPMYDQGCMDKMKRWSVHGCVNNYVELGVPLHK